MQAWSRPEIPTLDVDPRRPRVFDSATQALVEVGPTGGDARLYVCGITPYDATHLGHANTYLAFDLLNRTWRDAGLGVAYHAKPTVAAQVRARIDHGDLTALLYLQGYRRTDFEERKDP